jgi:hypothetical protein
MSGLRIHEQGHLNILHDYLDNFNINLIGKTVVRADEIVNQANMKVTDAENLYDDQTLHGQAQGAIIDPSITCQR